MGDMNDRGESCIPDDLRAAYLSAVMAVDLELGRFVVEPTHDGRVEGPFPDDVEVVHVITAWNPRSEPLPLQINEARQRRLRAATVTVDARWQVPAVGHSPDGTWSEGCLALADADESVVLGLAHRFEQYAVYAWTRHERAVVWTTSRRRDTTGWRCTVTPH